jgi:putative intracellular protease/amidase
VTTYGLLIFDGAEELDFAGPWEVFTTSAALRNEALGDKAPGGVAPGDKAAGDTAVLIAEHRGRPPAAGCAAGAWRPRHPP